MSITSFWRDSDFRTGGTRIRVWSREELIENSVFLIDVQPISVDFRIRPSSLAGTRANDFDIVFTDPAASASSETILEPIVYDIISLFGIPTATIQATVNGLTSGPIVVTGVASSRNQAMTEIDLLADSNTVDLPPSIPASGVVDQELEQQASGLQVYYEYVLRGTEPTDQFPIEVSARINYRVSERGTSGPYFPETTDYASLTYLTTGEFSEVYSQVYLPLVRRN
jgi:hypothetical protein